MELCGFFGDHVATGVTIRSLNDRTAACVAGVVLTALAFALRVHDLADFGLDTDEVFSVLAARSSWERMFSIVVEDKSHPPLHYILLKLSLGFGGVSEIWARLPSVLLGTGLVPLAYAICRKLQLKPVDEVLVLVLVASNSALIYFAQYARMFAALEFFAVLSLLLFMRLREQFSWRTWTMLTVTNTLMVYSHYWGTLAIVAQCILMLLGERRKGAFMVLSAAVTGALFLPWVIAVATAALHQHDLAGQISWMGNRVPGLIDYLWLMGSFNGFVIAGGTIAFTRVGLVLFSLPIAAFCLRAIADRRRFFEPRSLGFWLVLIATPLLLTSLGSYFFQQNLWGERHLSMLAVPYYVLIGLSLTRSKPVVLSMVLRCAILAWAAVSVTTFQARDDKRYHFERLAAAIAAREPAPVYVSEYFFVGMPLAYHLERVSGISVTEQRDLQAIDQDRFWYVYRDVTWNGAAPEAQLADRGYRIDFRLSTRWWGQTITALLLERPPP